MVVHLPVKDTYYIVSALVLTAAKAAGRTDCVAPATGHPQCVRKDGVALYFFYCVSVYFRSNGLKYFSGIVILLSNYKRLQSKKTA